jgi:phage shock protein C
MDDRLYRSRDDRVIAGVCGGIAEQYDLDPALVRIGFAFLILAWGLGLLLYIVMAIVVPEEPYFAGGPGGTTAGSPGVAPPTTGAAAPAAAPGSDAPPSDTPTPPPGAGPAWVPPGLWAPGSTGWDSRSARWAARDARRAARRARQVARGESRGFNNGGLLFGLILVIVGAYFLLRNYFPLIDFGFTWPLLIIAIGGVLILGALGIGRGGPPRP